MKKNNLYLKNNFKPLSKFNKNLKKLSKDFSKILIDLKSEIKNTSKTLNVLDNNFLLNLKLSKLKKFQKFKKVAIIGMGGSVLGSQAIYFALKKKIKKDFYFFNDINENKINSFKKRENINKVLFIIISKSGNTIETLSNTFSFNIIKKNAKNVIIISEKKNNSLFNLSKKLNLFFIEHKKNIGGRYSVLSEVGVVPAYFMGINILKLRSRLLDFLKGSGKNFLKKSSIKLSSLLISKKYNNLILLNYSPELEDFLFWCQQLISESLGKNEKGFLPVISNVPKDHHSLLQLYLDGPKDKVFYIFSSKINESNRISINNILKEKFLHKKLIGSVKLAQKNALIKVLKKKKIAYREIKINNLNEEILGKLFSYFILETVIIGKLSNINPFNQPAVEQVKNYTKRLLSKEYQK